MEGATAVSSGEDSTGREPRPVTGVYRARATQPVDLLDGMTALFPRGVLPQRLVIKYETILHGVPGRRISTSSLRKGALFHASSVNYPRETVVSLDTTRLGIKSVVLVALPGELFLDGPRPRPPSGIFN